MAKPKKEVEVPQITPELFAQFQEFLKMQQTLVKEEERPKKEIKKPKKITRKYLREKYAGETIELMNVTNGVVCYKTEKHDKFVWNHYGDVNDLTIDDILSMPEEFLKTPWLVIIDNEDYEDLIIGLGLKNNSNIIELMEISENVEELSDYEFEDFCKELSKQKNYQLFDNISSKVQKQITKGELKDYIKIARLEKVMNKVFTQRKLG